MTSVIGSVDFRVSLDWQHSVRPETAAGTRMTGTAQRTERTSSRGLKPRDFDASPLIAFYEVTQACGLVCKHCRACAQTQSHPAELDSSESRRLIEQLSEFPQPPMLVLTGGDPLCRPDIYDLIEHARRVGLEVSITPSATPLVTRSAIRRLRDAGIHRLAVSLDGSTAPAHDRVRGLDGIFSRSLEILNTAREFGIATQVNTTITPDNLDDVDAMANLLTDLKITLWSVFFLVPMGRADQSARLTAEQCETAFERLWVQSKVQPYLIKTTEAPHYRRFVLQQQKKQRARADGESASGGPRPYVPFGVNDGKGILFIGHTGWIYPSGFMPMTCGLFPLQNVVKVYQESPIFQGLRDARRLAGKCGHCEYRNVCGGSRARALAVTGDPYAPEPDCVYCPTS